jgi:hypothetical protein
MTVQSKAALPAGRQPRSLCRRPIPRLVPRPAPGGWTASRRVGDLRLGRWQAPRGEYRLEPGGRALCFSTATRTPRVGAAGRRCGGRLDGRRVVAALGAARRPSRARGLWVQAQRPITGEASWEGRHQSNGRKHSSLSPCLDPKIGTAGARGGGTRSPAVPIHNCCRTFHPRDRGTSGKVTGTRRSLTGHWLGTGRRAPPARDRHAPSP